MRTAPFAPWPVFGEEEIAAAVGVLRSGRVNSWTGSEVQAFEQEFARLVACRHAVAVANGTVALELALKALGVGPGDDVIVTARSFVASAGCCLVQGARPVFADVDAESQNITADSIRDVLTPRTKAIIAVHLAGWPCEMDPIMRLARQHGLAVIEDCAQAHGATYRGQPVGSLGDVAAFSFCQDKILTTGGEGGMLTTNRTDLWEKSWAYKDHGKSFRVRGRKPAPGFRWVHDQPGTNWRLTEMQAAIGRVMLCKLPEWLNRRRHLAAVLSDGLAGIDALRLPMPPPHVEHSYYKYYVFLRPGCLQPGWTRDRLLRALQAEGIPCSSGICPEIYREKAFDRPGLRPAKRLPVAAELGRRSIMLLVHPTLSEHDMADTVAAIRKVLAAAATTRTSQSRRAA